MTMNLSNTRQKLLTGKWSIHPDYLCGLYDDVMRLSEIRIGGLYGKVFGNPIIAGAEIDKVPSDAQESNEVGDIAIININGVLVKGANQLEQELLGYVNTDDIAQAIMEVREDDSVNQVILNVGSPGGEITGILELARLVKDLDKIKPVSAWTETTMQSAAYLICSQTRYIGMTPSAEVGSIGVWTMHTDISEKLKKEGINARYIYSGKYKVLGNELEALTPEAEEIIHNGVIKAHNNFKATVLNSRPNIKPEALEGLSYDGEDSLANGLVDIVTDSFSDFLRTKG